MRREREQQEQKRWERSGSGGSDHGVAGCSSVLLCSGKMERSERAAAVEAEAAAGSDEARVRAVRAGTA